MRSSREADSSVQEPSTSNPALADYPDLAAELGTLAASLVVDGLMGRGGHVSRERTTENREVDARERSQSTSCRDSGRREPGSHSSAADATTGGQDMVAYDRKAKKVQFGILALSAGNVALAREVAELEDLDIEMGKVVLD